MRHRWLRIWIVCAAATLPACGESGRGSPAKPEAAASAPAVAAAAGARPAAPASPLPADIVAFRERRDACDHFRGEDAYDAKRAALLAAEVAKACAGTDSALADLRQRHAGDARALAALNDYEDRVE